MKDTGKNSVAIDPYEYVPPLTGPEFDADEQAAFDREVAEANPGNPAVCGGKIEPKKRG